MFSWNNRVYFLNTGLALALRCCAVDEFEYEWGRQELSVYVVKNLHKKGEIYIVKHKMTHLTSYCVLPKKQSRL